MKLDAFVRKNKIFRQDKSIVGKKIAGLGERSLGWNFKLYPKFSLNQFSKFGRVGENFGELVGASVRRIKQQRFGSAIPMCASSKEVIVKSNVE